MRYGLALIAGALLAPALRAEPLAVSATPAPGAMALIAAGRIATVQTDPRDDPTVQRAAADLQHDLGRVAGSTTGDTQMAVVVGVVGHNALIDRLIAQHRLQPVPDRWEGFLQQVVDRPAPGISRALIVAGHDRRGAIYGAYDLSARIGVSPWSWWADVPVHHADALFAASGARADYPRVRYRGLFLNDEDPALKGWVDATYGGFNHAFYGRLFELVLRLKGNLVWPAMWGKAFYDDDATNKDAAERYGVIIGTSHHEPMMRAHVEWARYGKGAWDYATNAPVLRDFWRTGLARAAGSDHLVTIGMRGDGDEPMSKGTAIPLLETIVRDQRAIIADVTGKPADETPQVWALYKEVQDYYDQGMRVPDDVTLLFSDDNWGNLRRLPKPGDTRRGGYGIYYHFDYVGGPRNYKWINSSQIARTWDQMSLARSAGADRLWIANVGDLKPLELPTSFFLDYAWDPEAWPLARLPDYQRQWAAQQFGAAQADAIADILDRTTRFAARRKFELLSPDSWSLTRDHEAERVLADYDALETDARRVGAALPADAQDAYYELVLHDVEAAENLNRLYVTVARNRLHAAQGRADTNALADAAERYFAEDKVIARRYETRASGKWPHMMAQTHIGYTGWQEPPVDVMPAVRRIAVPTAAALGVQVPDQTIDAAMPGAAPVPITIERFGAQDHAIDLFDRGTTPARFAARSDAAWLSLDPQSGSVGADTTAIRLTVDWSRAPVGTAQAKILITGPNGVRTTVPVVAVNHPDPAPHAGFVEADGHVAIDAAHFDRAIPAGGAAWRVVPGMGRYGAAVEPFPQTAAAQAPGKGPSLDYPVFLQQSGALTLNLIVSPSLDTVGNRGLRYAVAIDDAAPQVADVLAGDSQAAWGKAVIAAARVSTTTHTVATAGHHVVHLWMIDPGLSAQRLMITHTPISAEALGPEESFRIP
ncbi:glycosyl hydrolase 115 family protein [uncultured Sphingomonas sp.]|uniref:glycosyl hydrolase 115 family protein n=1 Tax=uncultured Sphingomonas sp. TaxID=158754 RepID=UPI002607CA56|nr:glycosyl hydrolase 115 family protein [uncultured Sphingomonas sp.]